MRIQLVAHRPPVSGSNGDFPPGQEGEEGFSTRRVGCPAFQQKREGGGLFLHLPLLGYLQLQSILVQSGTFGAGKSSSPSPHLIFWKGRMSLRRSEGDEGHRPFIELHHLGNISSSLRGQQASLMGLNFKIAMMRLLLEN